MFKRSKVFNSSIVALSAFVLSLGILWSLHSKSGSAPELIYPQWQQPTTLAERFPLAISNHRWQFDFAPIEQALHKLNYTKAGELIFNANTAQVLEEAVAGMSNDMGSEALNRVEWLINKGFSQALATLTTNFYRYHQASFYDSHISDSQISTQITGTQPSTSHKEPEQHFQDRLQQQEFYFGKSVAERLFGQQNAVTAYLAARKQINENSRLSPSEKQQQLSLLQSRFKANAK